VLIGESFQHMAQDAGAAVSMACGTAGLQGAASPTGPFPTRGPGVPVPRRRRSRYRPRLRGTRMRPVGTACRKSFRGAPNRSGKRACRTVRTADGVPLPGRRRRTSHRVTKRAPHIVGAGQARLDAPPAAGRAWVPGCRAGGPSAHDTCLRLICPVDKPPVGNRRVPGRWREGARPHVRAGRGGHRRGIPAAREFGEI